MDSNQFMLWYRSDPKKELLVDVKWATQKFKVKYDQEPVRLLVPESLIPQYQALECGLEIKPLRHLTEKYFGVQ